MTCNLNQCEVLIKYSNLYAAFDIRRTRTASLVGLHG